MSRVIAILLLASLAGTGSFHAQQPAKPPQPTLQEQVKVRLLQVDALVTDKEGRTVPNLTKQDFQLTLGGEARKIDTFDVSCPLGAGEDPGNLKSGDPIPPPIAPGTKRRIIVALDYYFLPITERPQVLGAVEAMLRASKTPEEEVMIVALAYGVRVEQRFTTDLRQLVATLHRMGNDVTLWAKEFETGATGREYFSDLTTLMDVAGGHEGAKAVVLFSELRTFDRPNDAWFSDLALHAAAARATIYPSYPGGLDPGWRSDALARIANQSGGRMPTQALDITRPYRWAQRDLSCRYTLGVYVSDAESRKARSVRVLLDEQKGKLRFPEMTKLFTDEEKRQSSARAAFADPGPYEHALVRSFAFPLRPASVKTWDTLLALTFPLPAQGSGRDFIMGAVVRRGGTQVGKYESTFHVDPSPDGSATRPVTIFGDAALQAGQYRMTVTLSETGQQQVVSSEAHFTVPEMLEDLLVLRGPAFARVVPGAKMFRAGEKAKQGQSKVEQMLGADAGFEPLLINEIGAKDALLAYWSACIHGEAKVAAGAKVGRKILTKAGETVRALPQEPLQLVSRGKGVLCQEMLGKLEPGTLAPGDYRYEVSITGADGTEIAHGVAPLSVH